MLFIPSCRSPVASYCNVGSRSSFYSYFLKHVCSHRQTARSLWSAPHPKYFVSKYSTLKIEIGAHILNVAMCMKEAETIHKMHRPKPRLAVLVNSPHIIPSYIQHSLMKANPYSRKVMAMKTGALMLMSLLHDGPGSPQL